MDFTSPHCIILLPIGHIVIYSLVVMDCSQYASTCISPSAVLMTNQYVGPFCLHHWPTNSKAGCRAHNHIVLWLKQFILEQATHANSIALFPLKGNDVSAFKHDVNMMLRRFQREGLRQPSNGHGRATSDGWAQSNGPTSEARSWGDRPARMAKWWANWQRRA